VDPVSRRDFWKLLSRLQRQGLTILLTTPYLDEAERCARVALMDKGKLLTLDAPGNLRSQVGGSFVEVVARPRKPAVERLRGHPEVADVEVFGSRLHVNLPGVEPGKAAEAARRLAEHLTASGVEVVSARASLPSLEDVFIRRIRAVAADAPGSSEVTQ
jgi:ABC-2 type transport system ATP-binding protein